MHFKFWSIFSKARGGWGDGGQVGELMGGSQREERLDVLERRLKEVGLSPESYWWYMDLRRYGTGGEGGEGGQVGRSVILVDLY